MKRKSTDDWEIAVFKPCLAWFDPSDLVPLSRSYNPREIFHGCPQQKSAHVSACLELKSTISSLLFPWTASGTQWKSAHWMDEEHLFFKWDPFLKQQHSGKKACRWWLTQASPVVFGCVKPKHVSAADAPKQMVRNANRQNHPSLMCAEVIHGARTRIWAEWDWDHVVDAAVMIRMSSYSAEM